MAKVILGVGQACPTCNTPAIQGKDGGGYCLPCYIKWKNSQPAQPQGQGINLTAPQPINPPPKDESAEKPNWDKISWGKCKFGFLVEAFKKDILLRDAEIAAEDWADASMRKLSSANTTAESAPKPTADLPEVNVPF